MAFSNSIHQTKCVGRLACALAIGGLTLTAIPALAAEADSEQVMPTGGYIIISRDVGPRNALTPEVGVRYTVGTAPDPAMMAFATSVTAITDMQASEISGALGSLGGVGSGVQQALSSIGIGERLQAGESVGHSGSGVGDTVGGAIAAGMGALSSALGSISMSGQ